MTTTYPYAITALEQANFQRAVSYLDIKSLPEIWPRTAQQFGSTVALFAPHLKPAVSITYQEMFKQIGAFAAGLQALGIQPRTPVAMFADNSPRWFIADQGTMTSGAFNAVRSSQAELQELLSILDNSGSQTLIVEDLKTLDKLRNSLTDREIDNIILLSDEAVPAASANILNFPDLIALGQQHTFQPPDLEPSDLATLIYTSGTSGNPKGVMLTHANLLHQVAAAATVIQPQPGDRVLSILPSWHSYERTCEYYLLSQGCTQTYTNIRSLKADLREHKPQYMVAVPRLWESIYEGAQKQFREQPPNKQKLVNFFFDISQQYITAKRICQGLDIDSLRDSFTSRQTQSSANLGANLQRIFLAPLHYLGEKLVYSKVREATGGQIQHVISGGGALPKHIDNFFEIIGVSILVGYGLTETAPITNVRRPWRNLRPTSGLPLPGTEIKIVDLETRAPLAAGQKGLVLIRGPQIMQGYYRNPEATAQAIDPEGWFNSGDLGYLTPQGDLTITGRAKDTIVLSNGENIEPQSIEDACLFSPYIDQIMLVGQDQKSIGALIVPNAEALVNWGKTQGEPWVEGNFQDPRLEPLLRGELTRLVKDRPGYRSDDRIAVFRYVMEPFSVENGMLTQSLKLRRHVVMERYQDMIVEMFA
jgi:long-chain acyl-CoA synthetase